MTLIQSIWLLESGIELQYENDLKGKPGKTLIFKLNCSYGTFMEITKRKRCTASFRL